MSFLGQFRVWFQAQPLSTKRAVIRERLEAYLSDPMTRDIVEACPRPVQTAVYELRKAINESDWAVHQ